jgi:hypothetical protein
MEMNRDRLYEHGVMSKGIGWQVPRLPGLGEVLVKRGFEIAYRTLRPYVA